MKTTITKCSSHAVLVLLALAFSVGVSRADIAFYQNTFDDASSFQPNTANFNPPPIAIRFDNGAPSPAATFNAAWSTNDAATNINSGSAAISWIWNTNDGSGQLDTTVDLFPNATSGPQTNVSLISFDVMVDPSSATDVFNGYGDLELVTRDDSYNYNHVDGVFIELGNPTFGQNLAGTWQHVSVPVSGINSVVRALTIHIFNDVGTNNNRNINGPAKIYIDNLTLSNPGVTLPPTNSIAKAIVGLHQTTAGGQFDRQNLVTVGQGYSWVGLNQPVSYSVTITNYPGTNFSAFKTLIFLVPFTGTIEASADFNEASCIFFQIQSLSDGTASGTVLYKVQNPGQPGQGNFFGGDPDNPQNINAVLSAPSMLGKWALTFTDDDHFTITAPNGATLNTNLISGDGANFSGPLNVYFGPQANTTGNIGQEAVYSNFQIVSNGVTILNDNFSTTSLDLSKWVNEGNATTTVQVPPGSVYTVSWNLPDAGFSLQSGSNLANPASWFNPGLATPQYLNRRLANIPSTFVATNQNAFFRLISP